MKITHRLMLAFLLISVLPLAISGYAGLQGMGRVSSTAVGESDAALRRLGEEAIYQQAVSVARQVDLYLEAHPAVAALPPRELEADEALKALAVQAVGKTGYTAVYDRDGVTHFHASPKLIGVDLHTLSGTLPGFWAILAASLNGQPAAGYYDWQEADGSLRAKYMSCVPVGSTRFRVAATTYIDEFSQPSRDTQAKIQAISRQTAGYLAAALIVTGLLAVGLALWLAWELSRPIVAVTGAAARVEAGNFEALGLDKVAVRKDELGRLALVFQRMAREVAAREQKLKREVLELRIEIDVVRQQKQVREIVDTDFFRDLQIKARAMRARRKRL
jgi:signal transduction histidine kinase